MFQRVLCKEREGGRDAVLTSSSSCMCGRKSTVKLAMAVLSRSPNILLSLSEEYSIWSPSPTSVTSAESL